MTHRRLEPDIIAGARLHDQFGSCASCVDALEEARAQFLTTMPDAMLECLSAEGWRAYLVMTPFDLPDDALEFGAEYSPARCLRAPRIIYATMHYMEADQSWTKARSMFGFAALPSHLAHEAGHAAMDDYPESFLNAVADDVAALGGMAHVLPQHRSNLADPTKHIREIWADGLACIWKLPVFPAKLLYQMYPKSMAHLYKFSMTMVRARKGQDLDLRA